MKNEMTLQAASRTTLLQGITNFYSSMLGEKLTTAKTLKLINAQLAFVALILPVNAPLLFHLATLVWFASALFNCKLEWSANKFSSLSR